MINSIIVGSGRKRVKVDLIRDKDTRRTLGNKLKSGYLFLTNASFKKAKVRGERALSGGLAHV